MPNPNTLLDEHVDLKCEMVDRIFGHGYLARLQDADDLAFFLTNHLGHEIPRYEVMGEITRRYVATVEKLAAGKGIPMIQFERGQDKEDLAKPYFDRARKADREGVVLIGVARERARSFQAPRRSERERGRFMAGRREVFVKHYYFYIWDRDFGPGFIKFCTYAPFGIVYCLNGHQWLCQHLRHSDHYVEQMDNMIVDVDDPEALRRLCRRFKATHIQRFVDRWLYRLPSPLTAKDRRAGYTYQLSVLQLEVSRTEVFDRPLHGRQFFEEVVHDQLDLGRPQRLQLVFGRQLQRKSQPPRTRVFNDGTHISLHAQHGRTHVKQYWKSGRALRTETTFNDVREVRVGRKLTNENLEKLIAIGTDCNRRLLEMERATRQPSPAASDFEALVSPTGPKGQRAPGLRFGDPRVVALFAALSSFHLAIFGGFRCEELRALVEELLGMPYSTRQAAYDLRRLARKDLIVRLPGSHRYELTKQGRMWVTFCSSLYSKTLLPAARQHRADQPPTPIGLAFGAYQKAIDTHLVASRRAA